ncbi:MAG: hypothetical protein WBA53_13410, partial [Burkholderiaceae bacterium]
MALLPQVQPPGVPRDVCCYFDNTDKRHAPDNARRLMELTAVQRSPVRRVAPAARRAAWRNRRRGKAARVSAAGTAEAARSVEERRRSAVEHSAAESQRLAAAHSAAESWRSA